jgi:putative ATPase
MKASGYGQGYRYVHDDPAAKGAMACLPEGLVGRVYFEVEPEQRPGTRS